MDLSEMSVLNIDNGTWLNETLFTETGQHYARECDKAVRKSKVFSSGITIDYSKGSTLRRSNDITLDRSSRIDSSSF